MSASKILVTGGAGYIGSHVAKELFHSGFNPIVFDNLEYGHKKFVKWGEFVKGDLRNHDDIVAVIKKYDFIGVIHLAAYAYVGESVVNPAKYYGNNVIGSINLLEAMRAVSVKNIVFSSTCATYGVPKEKLITEAHSQNPINPYGRSKLMVEKILQDYDFAYGIKNICLRYFNAAGADEQTEIGEDHSPETHLIPLLLQTAKKQRDYFQIFGNDYPTSDGSCIRDYIHVVDLAKAHVLAMQYLLKGNNSESFNLGTGKGTSVIEMIEAVKNITGETFPIKVAQRRLGDPAILVANAEKAQKMLNWTSRYNDIHEHIEHAWKWENR